MPLKYSRRSTPTGMPGFVGGVDEATEGTALEVRADVDIEVSIRTTGTVNEFTAQLQATNGPEGGGVPGDDDWNNIDDPVTSSPTTYWCPGVRYKYWRVVLSSFDGEAGAELYAIYTLYQE